MTTYAKSAFNSALYASFRPTYPRQLFDFVFKYHEQSKNARWDTAVDLGCGPGMATTQLTPFKRVIGVDPSANMIKQAQANPSNSIGTLEYVQSPAEDLGFLADGSVDFVMAAQAAHWFNWTKIWPEVSRVLKSGGSAAFWGYSEFRLPRYPSLTPTITSYFQGNNPAESMGPYWQQPGRSILENLLLDIPSATDVLPDQFTDFQRVFYTSPYHLHVPSPLPVILIKSVTWSDLLAYFRTASAFHTFQEQFPEDSKRPDGDLAARFLRRLIEGAAKEDGKNIEIHDEVQIEWPLALILAKRT